MSIDIKTLMEAYTSNSRDRDYFGEPSYYQESEKKAREGLDDNSKHSKEDVEEYLTHDEDALNDYDTKTGKNKETGEPYRKSIEEFNSLIPHLTDDHQKARMLTNLAKHNALVDAVGNGEPHDYATDIQERALFNDYKSDKGILPKFDDLHTTIENDNKHYN